MSSDRLSVKEKQMMMRLRTGKDVPIRDLFHVIQGRWPAKTSSNRDQQQSISYAITRLNEKIAEDGKRIVPGNTKRTYALTSV